jgi:hypothetical protein
MAKKQRKEIQRYPAGINIVWGKTPIYAYQIYDITYDDGSRGIERGKSIRTLPGYEDFNGTAAEKKRASLSLRCDLDYAMRAAHALHEAIGAACWQLDMPDNKGGRR